MMSSFTKTQWQKVEKLLSSEEKRFGLPERRDDSFVMASFNIRKLGEVGKRKRAMEFLADFCRRCDLVAIQEVQDKLDGLNHLKDLLGDEYGMVASDITGGVVGKRGMVERLAFLFRWKTVKRTEVASDVSYDRTWVLDVLYHHRKEIDEAMAVHQKALAEYEKKKAQGKKPKKPMLILPRFLVFMRTPLCVSFQVPAKGSTNPYEFLAVNAHLLYGDKRKQKEERELEFQALVNWLYARAKQSDRLYHKNFLLFGDLNLDFQEVDARRVAIEDYITSLNRKLLKSRKPARVNFPFLDPHPDRNGEVFRTNARKNQTYDQIALFAHDKRLPRDKQNKEAGTTPGGYDYGMFNFVDLFSEALYGKSMKDLTTARKKSLFKKFEHNVSDHMPIWIRLPRP